MDLREISGPVREFTEYILRGFPEWASALEVLARATTLKIARFVSFRPRIPRTGCTWWRGATRSRSDTMTRSQLVRPRSYSSILINSPHKSQKQLSDLSGTSSPAVSLWCVNGCLDSSAGSDAIATLLRRFEGLTN
jgi:hypothetical protein